MQWAKYALITVVGLLFVSCYEVNEDIVVKEDGSGTYALHTDMGQLLQMMQTFLTEDDMKLDSLAAPQDSTYLLKDFLDPANATPGQKALLKDGKMNLQMNLQENILRMNMDIPFQSNNSLQQLMAGQTPSATSFYKKIFRLTDADSVQAPTPKEPDMNDLAKIYDVTIQNGLIRKQINTERYKALINRPEIKDLNKVAEAGVEVWYTTTIKLPRPVKKTDNTLVQLSADKKTATIKYNVMELLKSADKFSYSIEY